MAQLFRGKTLVVTGELQEATFEHLVPLTPARRWEDPGFAPRFPLFSTVLVAGLAVERGDDEFFHETAAVEVQGTLTVPRMVLAERVPEGCSMMVLAGQQSFWLDLNGRPELAAKAAQLTGKQVHVTGHLELRPGLPASWAVQVLVVDELTVV
jgi:hypothetical protein